MFYIILIKKVWLSKLIRVRKGRGRCGRRLDRHEQSESNGPGIEGHLGGKSWVPSNCPNWEDKDLAPGETFLP